MTVGRVVVEWLLGLSLVFLLLVVGALVFGGFGAVHTVVAPDLGSNLAGDRAIAVPAQ